MRPDESKTGRRRGSYRSSLGFGAASTVLLIVVGLVSSIVTARAYGVDVLGGFAIASAPSAAIGFLSSFQEQAAFVREAAVREPGDPRVTSLFAAMTAFSTALTALVGVLVTAGALVIVNGPVSQPGLIGPTIAMSAIYVVLGNTSWNLDQVLAAFRAGRELLIARLLQAVSFVVAAVAIAQVRGDVWGLVFATGLSFGIALLARVVLSAGYLTRRVDRAELRAGFSALPGMIRFGIKLAPGNLAHGVSSQVATWVLGIADSVAVVGAFNRAQQLGMRLIEANSRIGEVLFPTLVERRAVSNREGFDRALVDSLRYAVALYLLPAAAGGGAAVNVMALYGPGFERAADALAIILAVPALGAISGIQTQGLIAADRPLTTTAVALVRMVATVVATVGLTLWIGITGAAAGWAIGYLCVIPLLHGYLRPHLALPLGSWWPRRARFAQIVAFVLAFAASRAVSAAFTDELAGLVPALAAGTAVYGAAFVACGGLVGRDRARIAELRERVRSRRRAVARSG